MAVHVHVTVGDRSTTAIMVLKFLYFESLINMEPHNVIIILFVTNEGVLGSWNELKMASKLKFSSLVCFCWYCRQVHQPPHRLARNTQLLRQGTSIKLVGFLWEVLACMYVIMIIVWLPPLSLSSFPLSPFSVLPASRWTST